MQMFRFPPDSPYREQRLARLMPPTEMPGPTTPPEPENRDAAIKVARAAERGGKIVDLTEAQNNTVAGKLKGIANAVGNDPDVRNGVEKKMFELKAKQAMKTAFKNACVNRSFARLNGQNTYRIHVGAEGKAMVMYNTTDGRMFVGKEFDVGESGARLSQAQLTAKIEQIIADDTNFSEVIAPQIKTDNE